MKNEPEEFGKKKEKEIEIPNILIVIALAVIIVALLFLFRPQQLKGFNELTTIQQKMILYSLCSFEKSYNDSNEVSQNCENNLEAYMKETDYKISIDNCKEHSLRFAIKRQAIITDYLEWESSKIYWETHSMFVPKTISGSLFHAVKYPGTTCTIGGGAFEITNEHYTWELDNSCMLLGAGKYDVLKDSKGIAQFEIQKCDWSSDCGNTFVKVDLNA